MGVSRELYGYFNGVLRVFQRSTKGVPKKFQRSFNEISINFKWCFRCFNDVSRLSQGCFNIKKVSKGFQGCLTNVS